MPHYVVVSAAYALLQVVISFGAIYLPVNGWVYFGIVVVLLSIAYVLFKMKYYCLHEKVKIVTAVYWQVPEFMLWDLSVICKRKSRNLKRLRLLRWLSVGYRPPVTGCSRKLNE